MKKLLTVVALLLGAAVAQAEVSIADSTGQRAVTVSSNFGAGGGSGTLCGTVSLSVSGTYTNNTKCQGKYIHNDVVHTPMMLNPRFYMAPICETYGCITLLQNTTNFKGDLITNPLNGFTYDGICWASTNQQDPSQSIGCPSGYISTGGLYWEVINGGSQHNAQTSTLYTNYPQNCQPPIFGIGAPVCTPSVISASAVAGIPVAYSTNLDTCPTGYAFTPITSVFSTSPGNWNATVMMYSCVAN